MTDTSAFRIKNEKMNPLGVIGNPVKHSKSPLIHNHFIKKFQFSGEYKTFHISHQSHLKEFVERAIIDSWIGFNVTIPYKQNIIEYLDDIDDSVKIIEACNTVVIKDGKLYGYNTDAEGFYYPLENKQINTALVFGNGGASRAVIYQLCKMNLSSIGVVARDHSKSNEFIKKLESLYNKKIKLYSFDMINQNPTLIDDFQLVVNTTSVGMTENDPIFECIHTLNSHQFYYDLIYNPWKTKMIQVCKANNVNTINGAYMLAHQGALAFELFYNKRPNTEIMHDLLYQDMVNQ